MPVLPYPIQTKLAGILLKKSLRGGEFCLPFDPATQPFQIRETFPAYKNYSLEIGCGWGEFTRASALLATDTLFVAIEKKLARVLTASRLQRNAEIKNIRYLILDIAWFFNGVFAPQTFEAITINFPDPWPKLRHHKHRFISPEFAAELATIARPGCRITFATDNYAYAREAAQTFETSSVWRNAEGRYLALGRIAERPVSYFEQLHRDEGAPIYFLRYDKI